jgi:hypothetical protein
MKGRKTWRCFHCDEVFQSERWAREHFGGNQGALAGCQIKGSDGDLLAEIRRLEAELGPYREEDTHLQRAIASLRCEMGTREQRAEEEGYARGLRDAHLLTDPDAMDITAPPAPGECICGVSGCEHCGWHPPYAHQEDCPAAWHGDGDCACYDTAPPAQGGEHAA